jgi:hypothetical protein
MGMSRQIPNIPIAGPLIFSGSTLLVGVLFALRYVPWFALYAMRYPCWRLKILLAPRHHYRS